MTLNTGTSFREDRQEDKDRGGESEGKANIRERKEDRGAGGNEEGEETG